MKDTKSSLSTGYIEGQKHGADSAEGRVKVSIWSGGNSSIPLPLLSFKPLLRLRYSARFILNMIVE